VSEAALDLRPGELSVVVPLVAILIALSAWPDAISGHSFGTAAANAAVESALVEKAGGVNELASGTYAPGVGPAGCAAAASQFSRQHSNPAPGVYTVPCQGGGNLKITVKGSQSGGTTSTYAWSAA
jgi:hypothetical protein